MASTITPYREFPNNVDYPVSLAIWHHNVNRIETPISGDLQHVSELDRKMRNAVHIENH